MPGPTPEPAPITPGPVTQMINIIGSFGIGAFAPNPIQAAVGDMIAWTNNDTTLHRIVLDDGTDVGNIGPGQTSVPMALTTVTATYHCTIHPSMVGTVGDLSAMPTPPPPPVYYPPSPPDDYYGYY